LPPQVKFTFLRFPIGIGFVFESLIHACSTLLFAGTFATALNLCI